MAAIFCTSGSVKLKAGTNVSTDITDAQYTELINQAESHINVLARINYSDTYTSLNDDTKKLLEDAASAYAAMSAIGYDMGGFTDRAEAQTLLDINFTRFDQAMQMLKDKKHTEFIDDS